MPTSAAVDAVAEALGIPYFVVPTGWKVSRYCVYIYIYIYKSKPSIIYIHTYIQ